MLADLALLPSVAWPKGGDTLVMHDRLLKRPSSVVGADHRVVAGRIWRSQLGDLSREGAWVLDER